MLKGSEQQNIPDTRPTTRTKKMLILQLLFQFTHYHNRPHVYTTPLLSAQSTRHVLATNSSPDQITAHLHESEPKAPTSPSSITTLTLLSGLRNFTITLGVNSTKPKAPHLYNKFPALAVPGSKNIQEVSNPSQDLTCLCSTVGQNTISPDHLLTLASGPGSCNLHSSMLFFAFRCWMA